MCWGVTLYVITTRSNLFGFKENGQGGDTLPIFLLDAMYPAYVCRENSRYCYGLQVFSWSGFPDC
ncbi:hypothetical protein FY857_22585, partial [Escherichia coli]|nr:hypothetical protein [Escherichia coli]